MGWLRRAPRGGEAGRSGNTSEPRAPITRLCFRVILPRPAPHEAGATSRRSREIRQICDSFKDLRLMRVDLAIVALIRASRSC
jgi:hypothetical protein